MINPECPPKSWQHSRKLLRRKGYHISRCNKILCIYEKYNILFSVLIFLKPPSENMKSFDDGVQSTFCLHFITSIGFFWVKNLFFVIAFYLKNRQILFSLVSHLFSFSFQICRNFVIYFTIQDNMIVGFIVRPLMSMSGTNMPRAQLFHNFPT